MNTKIYLQRFVVGLVVLVALNCIMLIPYNLSANVAPTGYYLNSESFKQNDISSPGELIYTDNSNIRFKVRYTTESYSAAEVWGYRSVEGRIYRSIDFEFYEMDTSGAIWLYTCEKEGAKEYKVSRGLQTQPVELNEASVGKLISDVKDLSARYAKLTKTQRNNQALNFVLEYNSTT